MNVRFRLLTILCAAAVFNSLPHAYSQAKLAAADSSAAPSGSGDVDAITANNPAAVITQIQIESWYNPAYDGRSGEGNYFLLRPIVPFDSKGILPRSLVRLGLPVTSTPDGRTGFGDIQLLTPIFPGWHTTSRFKTGIGPVIVAPSATNRYAGQGQWQVGPSSIFIFTGVKELLLGVIADNPITVTGERSRPGVNALTVEPLIIKTWKNGYFFRFDPYWSFDWKEHGSAILPMNLGMGRLVKIRGQAVNAYIQPEFLARNEPYFNTHPPRVTLRFAVFFVWKKEY